MSPSTSHVVLLPSYNTGPRLVDVVSEVLQYWAPVLVVVDGSTDGSADRLAAVASQQSKLSILTLPHNRGKGAAVLAGAKWAQIHGFTHVLVMDADGQHPAGSIAEFMRTSGENRDAMVLGQPIFPANIPRERLYGRQLSIALVHFELLGRTVADPLFGFRVYPIAPLLEILGPLSTGRRYDFDTEAAVRLAWAGIRPLNVRAPVRYFSVADGGISHFRYVRDNASLVALHVRLIFELLLRRWPSVLKNRSRRNGRGIHRPSAGRSSANI